MSKIYSQGEATIDGTCSLDVDMGVSSKSNDSDLWWAIDWVDNAPAPTIIHARLVPQNGAMIAHLGSPDFSSVSFETLRAQQYSETPLPGQSDGDNKLTAGSVIAVRTNAKRYAKLKIRKYGYYLDVSWVTYSDGEADNAVSFPDTLEARIDPLALILTNDAYLHWINKHHPHSPKELERFVQSLSSRELVAVRNRATVLSKLAAMVAQAASKVSH